MSHPPLHEQIADAITSWLDANPGRSRADLARTLLPNRADRGAEVRLVRWLSGRVRPSDDNLQALADLTGHTFTEATVKITAPRK